MDRGSSSMVDVVEVTNQNMSDSVKPSNSLINTERSRQRSLQDKLKEKENYLEQRWRRRTIKILKSRVKEKSVMWESGDVSENLFEVIQKDTLHTWCILLKTLVKKRWDHAARTDAKIAVLKFVYIIGGFELTDQSVSKSRKYT